MMVYNYDVHYVDDECYVDVRQQRNGVMTVKIYPFEEWDGIKYLLDNYNYDLTSSTIELDGVTAKIDIDDTLIPRLMLSSTTLGECRRYFRLYDIFERGLLNYVKKYHSILKYNWLNYSLRGLESKLKADYYPHVECIKTSTNRELIPLIEHELGHIHDIRLHRMMARDTDLRQKYTEFSIIISELIHKHGFNLNSHDREVREYIADIFMLRRKGRKEILRKGAERYFNTLIALGEIKKFDHEFMMVSYTTREKITKEVMEKYPSYIKELYPDIK